MVIVIDNFGAGAVPVTRSQPVSFSIYEPVDGWTSLTNAPTLSVQAGIHQRGSSTLGQAKESWALHFHRSPEPFALLSPEGIGSSVIVLSTPVPGRAKLMSLRFDGAAF